MLHTSIWALEAIPALFSFLKKTIVKNVRELQKGEPLRPLWVFQSLEERSCRQITSARRSEVALRFQWGISPCRVQRPAWFIFLSEEIKRKKNLRINVKQVFLLLFLSQRMKLRWQNVRLDSRAGAALG